MGEAAFVFQFIEGGGCACAGRWWEEKLPGVQHGRPVCIPTGQGGAGKTCSAPALPLLLKLVCCCCFGRRWALACWGQKGKGSSGGR